MEAGSLRTRITFRKKAETKDSFNAVIEDWDDDSEDITDVPCKYEIAGTREFQTAWKRHSESTARFKIRFIEELAENPADTADQYRILLNDRSFNIFPPYDPDQRRRQLIIEARETV